jgi:hypothetical protein
MKFDWMAMGMREKLIEVMKDTRANAAWHRWGYEESADYLIENDVVPVVRCKDCKYRCPESISASKHCTLTGIPVDDDDFCSYGERKDNG